MAVINLTSEEFANRIEEMLDLASKGDNVLIWKIQCKLPPKTKRFCPLVLK